MCLPEHAHQFVSCVPFTSPSPSPLSSSPQDWLDASPHLPPVAMANSVATAARDMSLGRRGGGGEQATGRGRERERADRATVEQVLDPRTRMVLFKMLNRGVFSEINGCLSTGKEVRGGEGEQGSPPQGGMSGESLR